WAGVWASGDVSRKLTPPARRRPHSRQNFAETGLSWLQRGQRIEPILLHSDRDAACDENVAGRANIRPRRDPGHDAARLAHAPDLPMTAPASLRGHAALVTGAGRNIGRAIVLALAARGCDVVVNTRSRGADAAAAKHGLWGLTKALARELGPKGVTVNAISPGPNLGEQQEHAAYINSQLGKIPVGRLGTPDDIARLAAFLASDDGAFVSG